MFTDTRTEFQKMMNKAESGEIDVIVVMKLDRLNRDLANASNTIKLLNFYGCYLIAGDDISDSQTPSGEFVRNIILAQNQFHARRVASDVMASECNNAKKGDSAGGVPPYGLKVIAKRYLINEDEAPAVRLIFEWIANGKSYKQVIKELTRLGYKTRKGKRFSYSTLNSILHNDKYYGMYIYNRDGSKRKSHRVLIEHFDEVRNDKDIPAIITKELFDKVQTILGKRQSECRPHQNTSNYVITGLLFCKQCGKSMSGFSQIGGRNKTKSRYYGCPNHPNKSADKCSTKNMNADYIEFAVKSILTDSINDYLANSNFSNKAFDTLLSEKQQQIGKLSRFASDLDSKANQYLERSISATSKNTANQCEKLADECLTEKENAETEIQQLNNEVAALQTLMANFKSKTTTLTVDDIFYSDEVTRELFQIFIQRINVDDENDDIEIIFNTESK